MNFARVWLGEGSLGTELLSGMDVTHASRVRVLGVTSSSELYRCLFLPAMSSHVAGVLGVTCQGRRPHNLNSALIRYNRASSAGRIICYGFRDWAHLSALWHKV